MLTAGWNTPPPSIRTRACVDCSAAVTTLRRPEILDRVTVYYRGLSDCERRLRAQPERRRRRQCNGDHDDPEVDDHPTVRPSDQPSPCPVSVPVRRLRRDNKLLDIRRRRPSSETERRQWGESAQSPRYAHRRLPRRPAIAGIVRRSRKSPERGLSPREDRTDRHQSEEREPERDRHRVEVRRSDRDLLASERLVEQREDRAEQDDEREGREKEIVQDERALAAEWRVDASRRPQPSPLHAIKPRPGREDDPEEPEQKRPDVRIAERVHRLRRTPSG